MKFLTKPEYAVFEVRGRVYVLEANTLAWRGFADRAAAAAWMAAPRQVARPLPPADPDPDAGIKSVTLNMTHGCNLRCQYCYIRHYAGGMDFKPMPVEMAQRFLLEYGRDGMGICFMGGEPTLCMEEIGEIVRFAKTTFKKPHFNITTNGTMLTRRQPGEQIKVAEWLAREGFGMVFSLDGDRADHDRNRIYADGRGSFDEAMEGLRALKVAGMGGRVTLRGTFGREIVDRPGSLRDRLAYLNGLVYEGYARGVALEAVDLSESKCAGASLGESEMDYGRWQEEVLLAVDWLLAERQAGRKPDWGVVTRKVGARIAKRQHHFWSCGAGKNYITLEPDGTIQACHHAHDTLMGDLEHGIDPEVYEWKYADNRVHRRTGCAGCSIRYLCGGGCRVASLHHGVDWWTPVRAICRVKNIFVGAALWMLEQDKTGGV